MIAHYDIRPYLQSFIFSAIIKTFNENIPVNFSGENIYPVYYLKCLKIKSILIIDLIAGAHGVVYLTAKI
jgi:hypothetical protein